jgi:UPF0716 protein FxsA
VHWGKRIAIGLLVLPLAEVAAFMLVASTIGFFRAFGLMALTSAAGVLVLHHAGRGQIARVRAALSQRAPPAMAADGGGWAVALGGFLLLVPGFVTDVIGIGLLIPPVRRWLGATLGARFGATRGRASGARPPRTGPGTVIDLAPDEWRPVAQRESDHGSHPGSDRGADQESDKDAPKPGRRS